ncbi:MAG: hypothetical protein JSU06_13085 [Actinobacteria bacterium]|nr:hypothetical protein [Actinomycetota bacterium]
MVGRPASAATLLTGLLVLILIVGLAMWLGPSAARGDQASAAGEAPPGLPTAQQTKQLLESSGGAFPVPGPETDLRVAEELPHRDLTRVEALELTEGVFSSELEAPAGIFDELEPRRFLSEHAAVIPASRLPEPAGAAAKGPAAGGAQDGIPADQPVLVESTLPLRRENEHGEQEPVDLTLQSPGGSGGELEPKNPLTELSIPAHLGEGISAGPVQIELPQAAGESTPTNVGERYAFYPNVAENTDLVVAPTPTGVETMTSVRSAEAPQETTYRLSLPAGATLEPGRGGGAEVVKGGQAMLVVPPPKATDAAGTPVPVTMQVEGDQLKVAISPGPSTVYPVLVDPNYIVEHWCWSGCGEGYPGWGGSTTTPSYQPVFGAQWDPSHYGGLDLTSGYSGPAYSGTHTDWSYWVPRYAQDVAKYHEPPTTFVAYWMAEGVLFLPFGNYANYPAMVIGLIDPSVGWAGSTWVHYGGEGELANWGNVLVNNPSSNPAIKGADENLVTYEYESQAKYRDTFIGSSTIEVDDLEAPRILELTPPAGWLTGASATIGYGFEDTGLGVWSAGIGLPGEVPLHHGWGAAFGCTGTNASPCPRVVRSSETGAPSLKFVPQELPTGEDILEVVAGDPLWAEGHTASRTVSVKVDNTGPEISLSGALTEQEKLGTAQAEYPLTINATDGTAADPQSGVSKVEVKVDGKKITMANEAPWSPACKTENCRFSGTWTLKASEYSLGPHEVEVVATDAVGNVTTETLEVEFGQGPPQTSFTSPHPSYETIGLSTIAFKATRAGAPVEGATFRCSLDGAPPTVCASPYKLPAHFTDAWHTFTVAAVDKSGVADQTPATWRFKTVPYPPAPQSAEKLVYPEVGKKTASYYTLEAEWGPNPEGKAAEGVTGVTFQMELPGAKVFKTVPVGCTIDGKGRQVSWPLPARSHPGHSAPVYLKVRGCPVFEEAGYPEKEIQFRAVYDGGEKVAGASVPVPTEFVSRYNANRVSTDATESVGPASVDLLTGAFSLSRTDVSIPVPGYEANLEFTRTFNSTIDKSLPGFSLVMGGAWQPASPLESEAEAQAWTRVEEKVIPAHPAVIADYCWEEHEKEVGPGEFELVEVQIACPKKEECTILRCESWVEEQAQPREAWIELFDNEGASVPFEISGERYVSPEWARELVLHKEGNNIVLAYPNGTHTIFTGGGEVSATQGRVWMPRYISYQANARSMRMIYETEAGGKGQRLAAEIAPSSVTCPDEAQKTPGCRMLKFNYSNGSFEGGGGLFCWVEWNNGQPTGEMCPTVLRSIEYFGPSGNGVGQPVAQYKYENIPKGFTGQAESVLTSETDPRTGLTEKYTYEESSYRLSSLTPPGQTPWEFSYLPPESSSAGSTRKLKSVGRAGATTTLAYEVPVSGSGAPYDMSPESIARWGQTDLPVDATAIFPPNHVPSSYPPHEYTGATVHYMDPEGHEVNTSSPSPPGVSGASITTTETNVHGNVVRELGARNRLAALQAPEPIARSHELDSHSIYNAAGTELLESWGPLHEVRTASGEVVSARRHTVTSYDEGETGRPAGSPPAYLPTKETVAAVVPGTEGELEPRVTETHYNWALRKPEETVVDPGGLNIRTVTKYNALGQVEETRQPKGAGGGTAGDTRTVYYEAGGVLTEPGECQMAPRYANLPCKILPAKQTSGTGRPELPVKKFLSYNNLDEPTQVIESPGGKEEAGKTRKTLIGYDEAGRQVSTKIEGGGEEVPKTETLYSPTLGLPEQQRFVCEGECATSTPKYASTIGAPGSGEGQLNGPRGVAVDNKGDVWVVDRLNSRIEEFSESGKFLLAFGKAGTGNGEFTNPWGIAIDPAGNIWVADSGNCRIQEFNPEGKFLQKFGTKATGKSQGTEFVRPDGVAIAPGGKIWVTDNGGPRVAEFRRSVSSESERFVRNVSGTLPSTAGPEGVAVDSHGNVWFTEEEPVSEVREYDREGNFIRSVGGYGTGAGQFRAPSGIAVAPSGNIVVSDTNNNREEEFGPSGTYLRSFGSGTGGESFSEPKGVAITSTGIAFVADKNRNQIKKWNLDAGFNARATTTTYDSLGRPVEYEDADGNQTEITYDAYGGLATVSDAKGAQTYHYDETSGALTSTEVSGVGTFTAAYDANGSLVEQGLPNGLTAKTGYNPAGEPTSLAYTKTSSCGESCTWYSESLEHSIEGRILADNSTLVNHLYTYDKSGRLTEAQETPTGGQCTSRAYTYDADSNRLTKTTRSPGIGGACATSGGTTQKYEYDEADRLMGPTGPTYDAWGRITNLPAEFAGGKALTTSYFANEMVAAQSQGGVTNSFAIDATGRQRLRQQAGGVAGSEIFHYDGPGDSPAWTEHGATWTRNVPGIGGELAAVQESNGTTTFRLTDHHGDIVAAASSSPTATALLSTSRFSEFGEPETASVGRYGWLGGKSRRTELPTAVIQMGARSYIPQLGRFLTPDAVRGGSANAYDYANQDPVNGFDLGGERPCVRYGKGNEACAENATALGRAIRRVQRQTRRIAHEHHLSTPVVRSRTCTAVACRVGWPHGSTHGTDPVEHIAGEIVSFLVQHSAPTVHEAHEFLETWAGVGGYSNQSILGCAKNATEAWVETTDLRAGGTKAEKAAGVVTSALYSAVQCAVGALP